MIRAFLQHTGHFYTGGKIGVRGPVVINDTSGLVKVPPLEPGVRAYSASKAATVKLFDYFAIEFPGLKMLNFHPGIVSADMNIKSGHEGQDHCKY
jgi:NAD(P)-dependent dehydrogenase (short-subunit alcohol dehydrogenase family)